MGHAEMDRDQRGLVEPYLRADSLSFSFGDSRVLADVSFVVNGGELCWVTGDVGAGKSTLLSLCAGVLEPTTGTIERYVECAFAPFAGAGLDPKSTPDQLAVHAAARHGWHPDEAVAEVRDVLEWLRFPHRDLERTVEELSFGNRQKTAVALGVLAHTADLLLYDEPFAGLDGASVGALAELFDELRGDGTALMVANSIEVPRWEPTTIINL